MDTFYSKPALFHLMQTSSSFKQACNNKLFFPTADSLESFLKGTNEAGTIGTVDSLDIIRENDDYIVITTHPDGSTKRHQHWFMADALAFCFGLTIKASERFKGFEQDAVCELDVSPDQPRQVVFGINFLPSALQDYFRRKVIENDTKIVVSEADYQSYKERLVNTQYFTFFVVDTYEMQVVFNMGSMKPLFYVDKANNIYYSIPLKSEH